MVGITRQIAEKAWEGWKSIPEEGYHRLPAMQDVWDGDWLPGYHYQLALPRGTIQNCHSMFAKYEHFHRKISQRVAVEIAKLMIADRIPVVGVWMVTKRERGLVYGSIRDGWLDIEWPEKPEIMVPVVTPVGVGPCYYVITTNSPELVCFKAFAVTRNKHRLKAMVEKMAIKGIPLAGILKVTEHGQSWEYRSETVPILAYQPEIMYHGDFGAW